MVTEYPVKMCVILEPVGEPWVDVAVGGRGEVQQLTKITSFDFEFNARDRCCLTIKHFKKADNDPDTAVIIKSISFFGISDPRFVWAGIYYPNYPKHYPDKTSPLKGKDWLGWNGVYRLEFTVPVFTWMHQTQHFGWIYE